MYIGWMSQVSEMFWFSLKNVAYIVKNSVSTCMHVCGPMILPTIGYVTCDILVDSHCLGCKNNP